MSYSVYKHTSPNGKVYIGITSEVPEKRWGTNGCNYNHNTHFKNAINKYGWDNFTHEIIHDGLTVEEAECIERQLISQYDATNRDKGYNLTSGGEKGKRHSPESIEKMRKAKEGMYIGKNNPNYGNHFSEETRQKISNALKGKMAGEKNPNYGKPISEKQKKKISATRTGNHYPKLSESVKNSHLCQEVHEKMKKSVIQYTRDGEEVKVWKSAADAARSIIGRRDGQANICSCANGKLKSAYGYVWKHNPEIIK